VIRRLARKPLAMVSLAWVLTLIVLSTLAPWIAPYGPDEQDIVNAFQGPSPEHWLGTGQLGLDVLSRLLYGGRITLISTAISVGVYALVGVPLGLIAGYRGGFVDRAILRVSEVAYAIPGAVIVLVVLAIRPNDETAAMIALGLLAAPSLARVVRSSALSVREELFIRSARVSGLSDGVILRRHVLPTVLSTVIVHVALFATAAIGLETGLGFLGVGTTQVTWGQLVAEASANLGNQPWLLVPSGLLIISFILAFGLIGDGLRDATSEGHSGFSRDRRRRPAATAPRPHPTAPAATSTPGTPARADDSALLVVEHLSVAFEARGGERTVVQDVAFSVGRGEKLGIVGESGSGKSVAAAAVLGLLHGAGRVESGRMVFDGVEYDLAAGPVQAGLRGRRIGLIGQNPVSGLDPAFTVRFQLAEVVRANTGLRGAAVDERVRELLDAVQLPDPDRIAACFPHQLSGGMAQRVGIAAALAGDPELIFADEPTTALDVTVQAEILDVLRGLDAAVVLVTHDWGVLADLCSRAFVMYAGQIVEEGPVSELLQAANHPYTEGLLRSNPYFTRRGAKLPAIPGTALAPERWPVGCHFADRCPLAEDACRSGAIPVVTRLDGSGTTRCRRPEAVATLTAEDWHAGEPSALVAEVP